MNKNGTHLATLNSLLLALIVVSAAFVVSQGFHAVARGEEFPQEIAGLKLQDLAEKEKAKEQVYHLHGKDLGLDQAFVLRYGSPSVTSSVATVWLSRSQEEKQAEALIARMVEKVRGGAGPYGHFKELTVQNTKVVSLYGDKQRHFIYRRGRDVIWIEVDYPISEQFLEQALEKLK